MRVARRVRLSPLASRLVPPAARLLPPTCRPAGPGQWPLARMHSWTPARPLATPDALLHGRADPCTYVVSASLLPNELHHGIDLTARIKPAWPVVPGQPSPRHYYRMSLGPYDTLQAIRRPTAA